MTLLSLRTWSGFGVPIGTADAFPQSLAARRAIPALYPVRNFAVAGALMSYGTDFADSHRQCGIYLDCILKGEKPAGFAGSTTEQVRAW